MKSADPSRWATGSSTGDYSAHSGGAGSSSDRKDSSSKASWSDRGGRRANSSSKASWSDRGGRRANSSSNFSDNMKSAKVKAYKGVDGWLRGSFGTVFKIAIGCGLLYLALLAIQPWANVATSIQRAVKYVPLSELASDTWGIGAVLQFAKKYSLTLHFVAITLFFVLNVAETGDRLVDICNIKKGTFLWRLIMTCTKWALPAFALDAIVCYNQYPFFGGVSGMTLLEIIMKSGSDWGSLINVYKWNGLIFMQWMLAFGMPDIITKVLLDFRNTSKY